MKRPAESAAELLMLSGVVRECPDCRSEQIFVPPDDLAELESGCYCCTTCEAAILVDLDAEPAAAGVRGVA